MTATERTGRNTANAWLVWSSRAVRVQLVDEDLVGLAQQVGVLLRHLAQDPDTEPRARERVAEYHAARQSELERVVHNTIISSGSGIDVRNVVGAIVIANNAVYAQSGDAIRLVSGNLRLVTLAGNVGMGGLSGASCGYVEGNRLSADSSTRRLVFRRST